MLEISFSYHNLESFDYQFNLRSNFLAELFIRKLNERDYKIPKVSKVSIALIKNKTDYLFYQNGSVLLFNSDFELLGSSYEVAISSKYERFKIVLHSFHRIADKYNLDTSIIYDVYEKCLEDDLRNEFYWGKSIPSKEQDCFACLFCVHEELSFTFYMDIFKRGTNELVQRSELVRTEPYWFKYRDFLVPLKSKKGIFYIQPKGGLPVIEVVINKI